LTKYRNIRILLCDDSVMEVMMAKIGLVGRRFFGVPGDSPEVQINPRVHPEAHLFTERGLLWLTARLTGTDATYCEGEGWKFIPRKKSVVN